MGGGGGGGGGGGVVFAITYAHTHTHKLYHGLHTLMGPLAFMGAIGSVQDSTQCSLCLCMTQGVLSARRVHAHTAQNNLLEVACGAATLRSKQLPSKMHTFPCSRLRPFRCISASIRQHCTDCIALMRPRLHLRCILYGRRITCSVFIL